MNNYEDMSDFEINCEVLAVFEPDVNHMCLSESKGYFYDCGPVGDGWHQIDIHDYCNNPEYALPIILANRIGILPSEMKCKEQWISTSCKGQFEYNENPLRAAMIVFLKMNEDKMI